jgi:hypothetical protein
MVGLTWRKVLLEKRLVETKGRICQKRKTRMGKQSCPTQRSQKPPTSKDKILPAWQAGRIVFFPLFQYCQRLLQHLHPFFQITNTLSTASPAGEIYCCVSLRRQHTNERDERAAQSTHQKKSANDTQHQRPGSGEFGLE